MIRIRARWRRADACSRPQCAGGRGHRRVGHWL